MFFTFSVFFSSSLGLLNSLQISTVLIQIIFQHLFMSVWLIFQSVTHIYEVEHRIKWSSSILKLTCVLMLFAHCCRPVCFDTFTDWCLQIGLQLLFHYSTYKPVVYTALNITWSLSIVFNQTRLTYRHSYYDSQLQCI